jgi:hypothetical protein
MISIFIFLARELFTMSKEPMSAKSLTDWDRLRAMTDGDIDLSDCPVPTPEMFANAVIKRNGVITRKSISVPAQDAFIKRDSLV